MILKYFKMCYTKSASYMKVNIKHSNKCINFESLLMFKINLFTKDEILVIITKII